MVENGSTKLTPKINTMFWGVTLDVGKRYSQIVKQSFQLTMAALEYNPKHDKEFVQVMLQHDSQEYLLCTLQHGKKLQQRLDLIFATGEEVSFTLNGTGVVHLTGFLSPEVDESLFEEDESEDPDYSMVDDEAEDEDGSSEEEEDFSNEDDSDEAPELVSKEAVAGSKRKAKTPMSGAKRLRMLNESTGDDDDDDEDDDFIDDGEEEDDDDDEEEEEFSDDFEGSDFEDEEEESPLKLGKSPQKKDKKGKQEAQTPKPSKKDKAITQSPQKLSAKKEKLSQKQHEQSPVTSEPPTPVNGESPKKKKKKNKKKKKSEDNDNSMVESGGDTPKSPAANQQPKKRVIAGGTVVEDVKIGHGPEAKPGKMVSVYYVGTLAKNNKRFDSCLQGKPFRFRLNQGEVIKGWDNGVNGMKVGGKRKLLLPASQAYGNTRQGSIPPNSALQFEVELKAVS